MDIAVKHCKCQYRHDQAAKQHKRPKKSSLVAGPGPLSTSSDNIGPEGLLNLHSKHHLAATTCVLKDRWILRTKDHLSTTTSVLEFSWILRSMLQSTTLVLEVFWVLRHKL
jgi:hypothetical protein